MVLTGLYDRDSWVVVALLCFYQLQYSSISNGLRISWSEKEHWVINICSKGALIFLCLSPIGCVAMADHSSEMEFPYKCQGDDTSQDSDSKTVQW